MNPHLRFLAVVVLGLAAMPVVAADEPTKTAAPVGQNPPWLTKADKNGDGKLSREEFWNPDNFAKVDADRDGFATLKELQSWFAKNPRPAAGRRPADTSAAVNPAAAERTDAAASLDDVEKRPVVIYSDGTRMAGDLYLPKNRKPDEKFPAIVLCAGTGGTKGGTQARIAPIFARNGFVVLAFDYRGWGESESQLMAVEPQPKPDANNEMTIKVKALRWQMNSTDQTEDIRAAISFIAGEPGVDKDRIGLWGSSYGGGLVTYMAGTDPRVKCTAAQVPGGLTPSTPAREAYAYDLATKQARGETEPVPLETGKLGGKMAKYDNMRVNPAKGIGYRAQEAIAGIKAPILFVVAENEELSSNTAVEQAHLSLTQRGIPSKYHIIKGITHYGVYREGFEEATRAEIEWFNQHLKQAK